KGLRVVLTLDCCAAISTCTCPRMRIDFIAGWNVTAKPLECIDSETTMPLKRCAGSGRRTRMRVLYGWPFAVPETKYSSVTQPKSAGSLPGVSAGLRPGYMGPGPVIGPSNAGTGGTTKSACAV